MSQLLKWDVANLMLPLMDFAGRAGLHSDEVLHETAELVLGEIDDSREQHVKDFLAAAVTYLNKCERDG